MTELIVQSFQWPITLKLHINEKQRATSLPGSQVYKRCHHLLKHSPRGRAAFRPCRPSTLTSCWPQCCLRRRSGLASWLAGGGGAAGDDPVVPEAAAATEDVAEMDA